MSDAQTPDRKGEWVKVGKGTVYHFFYVGENSSRCGLSHRAYVPADQTFYLDANAPISNTCRLCRQYRKVYIV